MNSPRFYTFSYDVWGKLEDMSGSTLIGLLNPIRYRGYYYDSETGLYYVSSRYYDPEIGRWLNADGVIAGTSDSVQGYNQFAYCFNNPINMEDETGHWPTWSDVKKWAKKNIVEPVKKIVSNFKKIPKKELAQKSVESVVNNVSLSAGICIGIGGDTELNGIGIEAVSRIDIIGVQVRDGKIEIGHPGKSGASISYNTVSVGPQSEIFESINLAERFVYDDIFFDIGYSDGRAAAFVIGYHYEYSVSLLGIFTDMVNYIYTYDEEKIE